jgi:hypothetical protein
VRIDTRAALRGIEVLVAEQFLYLAWVRAGAQQLGREHMPGIDFRLRRLATAAVPSGAFVAITP